MPPRLVGYVERSDIKEIQDYLENTRLSKNHYRMKVNAEGGESQCFGIVNKRCLPPNLSRQCWLHPRLHYLLNEFGNKYVKKYISYTGIQVNVNYICAKHKDINNEGDSYIVAFGSFIGGELNVSNFDYDISLRGLLFNGSKEEHYTKPWAFGDRYSIVFHTLLPQKRWNYLCPKIEDFIAEQDDTGTWYIRRISDGLRIDKGSPLPHPLLGLKKKDLKN